MTFSPTRSTASAQYERLYATAMSRLPGIGEAALRVEMANAMQEFLRTTHAWRETIVSDLVAGRSKYNITPRSSSGAQITYIIGVQVSGQRYAPLSPDAFTDTAMRVFRLNASFDELTLYPTPNESVTDGLKVRVGLSLRDDSLDMPDYLLERYGEHLLDGVLERCFSHHMKPYTDKTQALYHHRRFRAAITRTRREVRGGDAQATPAWRFHSQAPGRPRRGSRSYGW